MKITLVRDDGKVNTLRTLKIELLLEQMKTEVKAQPVSKMRGSFEIYSSGKFD